jgi:uncharacterized OsmC-like protein
MPDLPPRQWTVRARYTSPGPVELFVGKKKLATLLGESGGTAPSPVEFLLLAVADCFALSLEIARKTRNWPVCVFDVACAGVKARDLPSRLERMSLRVSVSGPLQEGQPEQLLVDAKALCTVTNTLANDQSVDVEYVSV